VFELLAEIATGPTARVELCRVKLPEREKGKLCAVKRLHPHIAEDPQFQSMFVDEVWMTAALDHPNVVRVVGWGNDAEGTYLAVELVEGVSLARLMKTVFDTREAFTERMVVYVGAQICAGLASAHQLRSLDGDPLALVHRDLTPGNVLVGFDGSVRIADFGLAKAKQRVTKTLTGLLKGHPHYMAPEQATDGEIDARADLFSLGVVLFELFTGRHPWSGGTELEIFHVMANEPPEDILSLRPKLDKDLAMLVDRLLEKDPSRRYASADDVRAHLERWLDVHGYKEDNAEAVARFVRRNAMRQQRWFERAVAGEFVAESVRAKARLLGSRGRTGGPVTSAKMPAPVSSGATRRRALRRGAVVDDPTDETEKTERTDPVVGARIEDRPSNETAETPDWGEEVPTQVQTNLKARDAVRSLMSSPTNPRPGALIAGLGPRVTNVDAIPSFADDESDGKTTTVKAKSAAAYLLAKPQPAIRHASEDEVPTTPLGRRRPIPRLPPPPPREEAGAARGATSPHAGDDDPSYVPTRVEPMFPSDERTTQPKDRVTVVRTEADVRAQYERLMQFAARMQDEAARAARLAAHRAVVADLARDAAGAAEDAVQKLGSVSFDEVVDLVREAHRLEDVALRGDRQSSVSPSDATLTERMHLGQEPSRGSQPPPAPAQLLVQDPSPGPVLAGAAQGMVIGAPDPALLHAGLPVPVQLMPERTSYLPPQPTIDPRREPTLPGMRFNVPRPAESQSLFTGEVFGVPVWVALAVAFLIALGVVILVDLALR
jgi:eukaryotic-like serine/threonine-protein kinase